GANPKLPGSGWQEAFTPVLPPSTATLKNSLGGGTWTENGNDDLPINNVTWPLAFAFCVWDNGRLPTDAEWNLAAAAGSEQRVYPWISGPQPTIDSSYAIYDCAYHPPPYSCPSFTYCPTTSVTPCDQAACAVTCVTACTPQGCEVEDIAPVGARS